MLVEGQELIEHRPAKVRELGSWLNPKIAQVVVITVQKWIDKQLDVSR